MAERMIVCPTCDAIHRQRVVPQGARAVCRRCGTTLDAPRPRAMTRIVMLTATALVLMVAALLFPFLQISTGGMTRQSSVLDAVLAFSAGPTLPLTLAVGAFIILLPAARFALLLYVIAPMAIGYRPARLAVPAFRLALAMQPWAMAEIFIIGVAVALIKVADLATLTPGAAFWALVCLVIAAAAGDTLMCRFTLWHTLEQRRRS